MKRTQPRNFINAIQQVRNRSLRLEIEALRSVSNLEVDLQKSWPDGLPRPGSVTSVQGRTRDIFDTIQHEVALKPVVERKCHKSLARFNSSDDPHVMHDHRPVAQPIFGKTGSRQEGRNGRLAQRR